jgi:hypothetical protein
MDTAYPPAPWSLRGDMYITVLRMPPGSVPADILPHQIRLGRPGRGMTLAVAFVDYQPGGDLAYREFLVSTTNATLTSGTILKIWVDSVESLAGGREMWLIPKEFADFKFEQDNQFTGIASIGGQVTASYTFTPKLTLPGRWRLPNSVTQGHGGVVRRTRSTFRSKLQLGSGTLEVPEDSPVAFLRRGRILGHVAMRDFTVQFGIRSVVV